MSRTLAALALVSMSTLVGCGEEEFTTCETLAQEQASLEIGVGTEDFEPVEDGDWIEADRGVQGGSHIYVGVRTFGMEPGGQYSGGLRVAGPEITWKLYAGDDELVGEGSSNGTELTETLDGDELTGQMLYLANHMPDEAVQDDGESYLVMMAVRVEDSCGTVLTEERELLLTW